VKRRQTDRHRQRDRERELGMNTQICNHEMFTYIHILKQTAACSCREPLSSMESGLQSHNTIAKHVVTNSCLEFLKLINAYSPKRDVIHRPVRMEINCAPMIDLCRNFGAQLHDMNM